MRETKMKHCDKWRACGALLAALAMAGWLQEAQACNADGPLPSLDFGEMVYGIAAGSVVNGLVPMSEWIEISGNKIFTDCDNGAYNIGWIYSDRTTIGTYVEGGEAYSAFRVPSKGIDGASLAVVFKRSYNDGLMKPVNLEEFVFDSVVLNDMRFRIMARILIQAPIVYGRGSLSYSYHLTANRGGTSVKSHLGQVLGNFLLRANTCAVISEEDLWVRMESIAVSELQGVGGKAGGTDFELRLRCEPGVRVYATMTDASNPANRTATLSLVDDSTRGVGFEILRNGSVPVFFGPDSPIIGAENQFHIGDAPASGGEVALPLKVRYVQTAPDVTPGEFYAKATITFSYQ
jgi:type 1 fimbria pilin